MSLIQIWPLMFDEFGRFAAHLSWGQDIISTSRRARTRIVGRIEARFQRNLRVLVRMPRFVSPDTKRSTGVHSSPPLEYSMTART